MKITFDLNFINLGEFACASEALGVLLAELEERLMSALSDQINAAKDEINAEVDAAVGRVQADVSALQKRIADLEAKAASGDPEAKAAIEELKALVLPKVQAIDPTDTTTLPPAP